MLRDLDKIAFEGSQERAAFERLIRERPDLWWWFDMGNRAARTSFVRIIRAGRIKIERDLIDAAIDDFLEACMRGLRQGLPHEQADEEECFACRLGFTSLAYAVRENELAAQAAARSIEYARQQGEIAGRATALGAVEQIRLEPHLRPALAGALEQACEDGAKQGLHSGLSEAQVLAWRRGFSAGADRILSGALKQSASESGQEVVPALASRPETVAPVPQQMARPLRPDDLRPLPPGLTRH